MRFWCHIIGHMKNELPILRNKELNQFARYCDERFTIIDYKFSLIDQKLESVDRRFESVDRKFEVINTQLVMIIETTAEILEKINHLVDVLGKTRADIIDLQYRVGKLELK